MLLLANIGRRCDCLPHGTAQGSPWSTFPIWSMLPTVLRNDESFPESSAECRGNEVFGKTCVFSNVCYFRQSFWCVSSWRPS